MSEFFLTVQQSLGARMKRYFKVELLHTELRLNC